jgi:hypothetical protein
MVLSDSLNDRLFLTVSFCQISSDFCVRTIYFMCERLSDVMQEARRFSRLRVGADLRSEYSSDQANFNGMLKDIFAVTVSEFQPPNKFNEFGV